MRRPPARRPAVLLTGLLSLALLLLGAAPPAGAATLTVTTAATPPGQATAPYLLALQASGGTKPYRWSVGSGALPAGLSLSTGGALSGTPTGVGSSSFTLRVADGAGATGSRSYTLAVGAAASWSLEGRDAARTGSNPTEVSLTADNVGRLRQEWEVPGGFATSGVAVDGGRVYVTAGDPVTDTGSLYALDLARGTVVWKTALGGLGAAGSPVVDGGAVYVVDQQWHLRCFDAATGKARWSTATTDAGAQLRTPTVTGGVAYASGTSAGEDALYAFDAGTGARRWKVVLATSASTSFWAPTVAGGTVYALDPDATDLYARSATNGSARWKHHTGNGLPPSVAGDTVYVPSSTTVLALDAATGGERWRTPATAGVSTGVSVAGGRVSYGVDNGDGFSGSVVSVSTSTHARLWLADGSPPRQAPVVAGLLWVADRDGGLTAYDPATGAVRAAKGLFTGAYPSTSQPLVVVDGRVLAVNHDRLVAWGTAPPLPAVTTPLLADPHRGLAYGTTLGVRGGVAPFSWSVVAGSLPAGLSLSSSGRLAGTPTTLGPAAFTVRVRDAVGGRAERSYRTTVVATGSTGWDPWRFDAAQTGYDPYETALDKAHVTGLSTRWSADVGDRVDSAVVVLASGRSFATAAPGTLTALDADGSVRWRRTGLGARLSSPVVVGGRVVVADASAGRVRTFDADTGAPGWSKAVGVQSQTQVVPTPAVTGGLVYLPVVDAATDAQQVWALAAGTGAVAWEADLDPGPTGGISSPAVAGGRVYVDDYCGLYALDAATGARVWRAEASDGSCFYYAYYSRSPVVSGDRVVVAHPNGSVYAFRTGDGRPLWHLDDTWAYAETSAAAYGALYLTVQIPDGGNPRDLLLAVDLTDGEVLWATPCHSASDPAVADGLVYAVQQGAVSVFDATSGRLVTTSPSFASGDLSLSPPSIAGGRLYVGAEDGHVLAFGR